MMWTFMRKIGPALLIALVLTACASQSRQGLARREPASDDQIGEIQKAEALMSRQTTLFDSNIYATSGFKNSAAMTQFVLHAGDDNEKAYHILESEEVEIAIAAPEKVRTKIFESAFKNTFETGTSGGIADDGLRNMAESLYLGLKVRDYELLPASVKPKYGYLAPKPQSATAALHESHSVWFYGEDRWVLKLDKVRNRLSLSANDSVNKVGFMMAPGENQIQQRYLKSLYNWSYRFVPWSRRSLLAPMLAQGISAPIRQVNDGRTERTFGPTLGLQMFYVIDSYDGMRERGDLAGGGGTPCVPNPVTTPDEDGGRKLRFSLCTAFKSKYRELKEYCQTCVWSSDFIEAQIWGPISPDDIQAFVFTKNPPSAEFAKMLVEHHIEIRDGRYLNSQRAVETAGQ